MIAHDSSCVVSVVMQSERRWLWRRDAHCPLLNVDKVKTDGFKGKAGGDNYGEGNLDTGGRPYKFAAKLQDGQASWTSGDRRHL